MFRLICLIKTLKGKFYPTLRSVMRFKRRNPLPRESFEPTLSVKIGFIGGELPKEVTLNYTKFSVGQYFLPVGQCYKCGRLGHTSKGCHSKRRCLNWVNGIVCNPVCAAKKCILCMADGHVATNRQICKKWRQETEISKIMTIKKLSHRVVVSTCWVGSNNRFVLLAED